jgi:hypothetical protein
MGILSFSLNREKVESGAKPHTIRFRKEPPSVGESLFLWWKSRTIDRDFIGSTICTRVDEISIKVENQSVRINGHALIELDIEKLAIADGFDDVESFWKFFSESNEGFLIHWNPDYITRKRILPRVMERAEFESDIVPQPIEPYYPPNGSETCFFDAMWCDRCKRNKGCFVYLQALNNNKSKHWIQIDYTPICTAFINKVDVPKPKDRQQKRLEKSGQLNFLECAK